MAEPSEEEPKAQHAQDPALAAIWEVLVRIEANTKSANKGPESYVEKLWRTQEQSQIYSSHAGESQDRKFQVEEKMDAAAESSSALQEKVSLLENNLASCENQRVSLEKNLNELSTMHDELEKYTRKFNLEIQGIPEEWEEDTQQIIPDLARYLDISMEPEDIDIIMPQNEKR